MKIFIAIAVAIVLIIGGAVYYLYPTLYGIIPDSSNTPRLSDFSPTSSENSEPESSEAKAEVPAETIIAEGLDTPWAIAFLPNGNMLVTERKGTVRLVDKNGNLQAAPVATIQEVNEVGEGGLLGIALHPKFETNHYVYLYYTTFGDAGNSHNKLVRMKYEENLLKESQTLIDKLPSASNHNGGRIKFGPDNYLYITIGDAQEPSLAQDTNYTAGKILRVTDEGKPAPGNPFNNMVYSYGHRNPQGLAWDQSGHLWETEHGPSGGSDGTGQDEINLIEPGNNYGWPTIKGDQTKDGMISPVKHSTSSVTWAPGGAAILDNTLYFGGLRGQALYSAKLATDKISVFNEFFKGKYGRIREVIAGPDNMLYLTTSNKDGRGVPGQNDDRIIRINPAKLQ